MDPKVLHKISYGLYVITSRDGDKMNGQIANTLFQIASEPATIAVSINKENLTHQFIMKSRIFAASVLARDTPLSFIGQFGFKSGRDTNKFANVNYRIGKTGVPIITDNSLAYIEAEVVNQLDCGTHTIFVGRVIDGETLKDAEPMTYAYYHEVKRGTAPMTAPTYIKEEPEKESQKMAKYRCSVCGYVYDPAKGDPDSGVAPGTPFEKLPDNWSCPVCGAAKEMFEKIG
jgi:flavin reductase (DIM6/NTAB) family NADH-FMN oxidoreductase RutF/rubredoxin